MNYRRIIAAALAAFTLFAGATALAAGTAADPLVSRSHLERVFSLPLREYAETALEGVVAALESKTDGLQAAAESYARGKVAEAYAEDVGDRVTEAVGELLREQHTPVSGMTQRQLVKGDRVTGPVGASVMFLSGEGKIVGPAGAELINITAGGIRQPGAAIRTGILYMMTADDGSGIEVTSSTATVLLKDGARGGYEVQCTPYADALRSLGLFRGSDKGYELERAPSRVEALVMLIRILGEEQAALAGDSVTPFTDLNIWEQGKNYVAYGWRMKYTNGTGGGTFSPNASGSLEQYLTFVLRSLGYRDGEDFIWNTTCRDLALRLGLLTAEELTAIDRDGFRRDHVALISYRALYCPLKDGSGTLSDRLCAMGVLSGAMLEQAAAYIR